MKPENGLSGYLVVDWSYKTMKVLDGSQPLATLAIGRFFWIPKVVTIETSEEIYLLETIRAQVFRRFLEVFEGKI